MPQYIPDPDLNRLVQQLNREPDDDGGRAERRLELGPERSDVEAGNRLEQLLRSLVAHGGSDLLLITGVEPTIRLAGQLQRIESTPLSDGEVLSMFTPHLSERLWDKLREQGAADFSIRTRAGDGGPMFRFRVNVHRQREQLAASIRALPAKVPSLSELRLPETLADLVAVNRGLMLVCGPTGSGKTTTLAALVELVNRERAAHIVTIEDPIEYEHENRRSIIEQIEVGRDAPSFASALRSVLRQDPDVILVGEMRDPETVAIALTAAETGHLVLSTLHTADAVQAVHRIVDSFPSGQQPQIRHQLALSLHAIISQQLVPTREGKGRVPALEILIANYPIRNHIRKEKLQNVYSEITLGKRAGMISLEESLARLVRSGAISPEEARMRSGRQDELESALREV
jgi:twitching motility protein PilT